MATNTRSNSLTRQNESRTRPREQETSPDMDQKQSKKVKTDMQMVTELLMSIKTELSEEIKKMEKNLNAKIDGITSEINKLRSDIKDNKQQMEEIKAKNTEHDIQLNSHEIRLNTIDQMAMENQLMVTNLPLSINKEKFLEDINKWSNNMLSAPKLSKTIINTYKNSSKTAFIHFHNVGDKTIFMQYVNSKQHVHSNTFSPITNEMIFSLSEDDISRAKVVDFRTPLTDINKQIQAAALKMKKEKKCIQSIKLVNGSIQIRLKGNSKPMFIHSTEQLDNISTTNATQQN